MPDTNLTGLLQPMAERRSISSHEKGQDTTDFIMSEDGTSILALRKPTYVYVPLLHLPEETLNERIGQVLEAASKVALWDDPPKKLKTVPAGQVVETLSHELGGDLSAVVASPDVLKHLPSVEVPVHTMSMSDPDLVIGLRSPEKTGKVIRDKEGKVGILVHGDAVAVVRVDLT